MEEALLERRHEASSRSRVTEAGACVAARGCIQQVVMGAGGCPCTVDGDELLR